MTDLLLKIYTLLGMAAGAVLVVDSAVTVVKMPRHDWQAWLSIPVGAWAAYQLGAGGPGQEEVLLAIALAIAAVEHRCRGANGVLQ